jgi:hypothetical protein
VRGATAGLPSSAAHRNSPALLDKPTVAPVVPGVCFARFVFTSGHCVMGHALHDAFDVVRLKVDCRRAYHAEYVMRSMTYCQHGIDYRGYVNF